MVLGLIDFLLGGKKNTKVPKTGRAAVPQSRPSQVQQVQANPGPAQNATNLPDGASNPTPNVNVQVEGNKPTEVPNTEVNEESKNETQSISPAPVRASNPIDSASGSPTGQKKSSVSEAIGKLHTELKTSGERITGLVTDFKNLENSVGEMGHRIDSLEEHKKSTDDKLSEVDENMTKFLSLYELINNQYNPFVDKDAVAPVIQRPVTVEANGETSVESLDENGKPNSDFSALKSESSKSVDLTKGSDLDSVLFELDTLDIEEAAADAVPLTSLNNNTNSLVIILSWLEYLIKRVGLDETRNSLRYYTEVLRWITPEVYFELDKYLRGMKDVEVSDGATLSVRDHIVSLYFISKLNKKQLDEKLTNAVLQIIKN